MIRGTDGQYEAERVRCSRLGGFSIPVFRGWVLAACFIVLVPLSVMGDVANKAQPILETPVNLDFDLQGFVGDRLRANLNQWEPRAPRANPAMTQMFRDRDRKPGSHSRNRRRCGCSGFYAPT